MQKTAGRGSLTGPSAESKNVTSLKKKDLVQYVTKTCALGIGVTPFACAQNAEPKRSKKLRNE